MEPGEIAAAIGVELVGRLPHGEGSGAYEIRTAGGDRAVLKLYAGDVLDLGAPPDLVDALRARGYPAPATRSKGALDGTVYEIQEYLRGDPMEELTPALLPQVLALNGRQRDVGLIGRGPWIHEMVTSVLEGRTGYCEHAAMASHSNETQALLDLLLRIADGARGLQVSDSDVVHFDFSPYNVLTAGDRITGVVDWDGATNGDAAFDLVTLASYTYDYPTRDALLAAAAERTDPDALALYAAHMVLRQVDWTIRHHEELEVQWFIGIGTDLLTAVGAH
ncbi:MAG TPA: aminoglycoside phosphotransferase family protein [Acidimicrobiia bacterium]|nr:aminoglycoside phosphotransferase family protein [Acidimicrobiia bacterium]